MDARFTSEQRKTPQTEGGPAPSAEPDEHYLPPRKTVHPTERERWVRFFYRSLLWIFILLVSGLLLWGWKLVKV
ncbi:hypothetical protein O9H85_10840 [Paenibacillus filicis]|uniref:Uncharacterized protein n=1 Tax=Paenibacillus gyeongsangnamensis TaxID=3388067 RepID=A0ABT4Q873_9BACL|nr:hypothetical protein [Paenibacillus filicis]MCZ8512905.1 hypothetical protein [Paenibacillus filicis]